METAFSEIWFLVTHLGLKAAQLFFAITLISFSALQTPITFILSLLIDGGFFD